MRPRRSNRRKPAAAPARRRLPAIRLPQVDWRRVFDGVLVVLLLGAVYSGTLWLLDQPIQTVRIEAPFERVTAVQVEAAITPYIEQGFLTVDLARVQQSIEDLPWVAHAAVRRAWPASLQLVITEERAAARWREAGLLNVYGELFVSDTSHIPAELPLLSGPDGTERKVAERFFALQERLQQRGLHAVALSYDRRGAWQLGISNGMQVRLGTSDVELRTERFFQALDQVLAGMADRIHYIDMRYTNGFAVGWKPSATVKLADTGTGGPHGG